MTIRQITILPLIAALPLIESLGCGGKPATVTSITVKPNQAKALVGQSVTFTATATYIDGRTAPITVQWTYPNPPFVDWERSRLIFWRLLVLAPTRLFMR